MCLGDVFYLHPHTSFPSETFGRTRCLRKVIQDVSRSSATRHPVLEIMVELMMQKAPSLFPTKEVARQRIVPAFIKHNLLPSLKGEPETPS